MDILTYNKIFDPTIYTEHQAANSCVNSASLITLMSVSGKGMLEEALIYNSSIETGVNTYARANMVITIDGNVILNTMAGISATTSEDGMYTYYQALMGVYPTESVITVGTTASTRLLGVDNLLYGASINFGSLLGATGTTLLFPSATQQSGYGNATVGLEQPIYFKSSLLIQVSGVSYNTYSIQALAKARY